MKFRTLLLALASVLFLFPNVAPGQLIRLRNEVIDPAAVGSAAAKQVAAAPQGAGLYIVQFTNVLTQPMQEGFARLGVDFVRYIPDSAYIVRVAPSFAASLKTLPGISWVGAYTPDHKLDRSLQVASKSSVAGPVDVSVVVVPRASATDLRSVEALVGAGAQRATLRGGTVFRATVNSTRLAALAGSDAVLWIEPRRPMKLFDEVASKIVAGDGGENKLFTASLGYDGSGVTVSVVDSGLQNGDAETMHPDLAGRTPVFFHYGDLTDAADEHSHGTHVAGIVAGNGALGEVDDGGALFGLGVAPGATIIAQRIFDGEGNYKAPPSFERLTRDAVRSGADIGSNSWGEDTQGRYDVSAMEFDELVRDADALTVGDQQYILEFSAGNAGPGIQTIGSPAVAKNVLATGACQNDRPDFIIYAEGADAMADFSSRGPCEDGRIKPDVVAPGSWIASLLSASATDQFAWSPISDNYLYQGGTSQAGPHASGAAAVFVQYYREQFGVTPSPAMVKAAMINCAVDLDDSMGTAPAPNMDEGWGRIDLTLFFDSWLAFTFRDQHRLLTNSQVYEERVLVSSPEDALKVTLAYTDVPGFPGAAAALVNDLDLEAIAPDGTVYHGNQFDRGESIASPSRRDAINNVEGIYVSRPKAGEWVVRVTARRVVEDARIDTPALDQDFALCVSAILPEAGFGEVILDRFYYSSPDQIRVTLIDTDLAGQSTATVVVTSTSEPGGETLSLSAASSSGVFTGAVATATSGVVPNNGVVRVSHGDTITARYNDASLAEQITTTARADLVAPVISNVQFTNQFGQVVITWNTDEPSDSQVYFGTNNSLAGLGLGSSSAELVDVHSATLPKLVPGRTYYFYVTSRDEAGNVRTNSNGGALYSFVAAATRGILLVDQYVEDPFVGPAPPIGSYTEVLDQLNLPYEVWSAETMGSPANVLEGYRTVIWRVQELGFTVPTVWTPAEQNAISNYLNSGGSLLVASMELLSRLEEVSATNFIRNVLQVESFQADPVTGVGEAYGVDTVPMTSGFETFLDYQVYDDLWGGFIGPDLSDVFTPTTNATAILRDGMDSVIGLRWPALGQQAPGRLVLLSIPLDAVPLADGVNDRLHLMRNIMTFLAPGVTGSGNLALDSTAYNLPSVVRVEIGDSDLAGAGVVVVRAKSITQPSAIQVQLHETSVLGVFEGSFFVVGPTNNPQPGQLLAQSNDTITVEYDDASENKIITATAVIDTAQAALSSVESEVDYAQAVVYWETSEPANSLVQFGKSALLDRTAYNGDLVTSHAVVLPFLEPDQTYRFQVVSRDAAGNVTTDDNRGALYFLRTLRPLFPPWFDNLDNGTTNWSVYNPDGGSDWTLGVPNNSLATEAFSPPNAWGSNLKGEAIDIAEKYLISPAIYLTNGNTAKLKFTQNYDFSDLSGFDFEFGAVQLVVDNSSVQVDLGAFMDSSGGWEEVEFDLTPYMGKIVYLVWYHFIFTFEGGARPGWLIDDVSVTVSNVPTGRIEITNNISQAEYLLSGPVSLRGRGFGTVVTNAPPGDYLVEYVDVPHYTTPVEQAKTLAPGATLKFTASYSFADVNTNGMPDSWESTVFGSVSPTRTANTDSDGDGLTDYAEFVAGTIATNNASKMQIGARMGAASAINLTWAGAKGRSYRVEAKESVSAWRPVSEWIRANADGQMHFSQSLTNIQSGAYFRVQVLP